ncbi:MAG: four helix bundle protein [bacterium]|nr:four helix bundle protein [bacterium]
MAKEQRKFDLEERLINFAVRAIAVVEALPKTLASMHLGNQLVRCSTSPAHNYAEAQGAESLSDFIHKMKIALKELRETHVCLRILAQANLIKPESKLEPLLLECNELIAIFVASIATAKKNQRRTTS